MTRMTTNQRHDHHERDRHIVRHSNPLQSCRLWERCEPKFPKLPLRAGALGPRSTGVEQTAHLTDFSRLFDICETFTLSLASKMAASKYLNCARVGTTKH